MNFGRAECTGVVDAVSRLRALAARRTGGTGVLHHMPRNDVIKPNAKGCVGFG